MNFSPWALFLPVVGGLLVAGLLGWIRKPRLVVMVPKTFSYSQISDKGQLAELTIFNRSFKTEEAIDVTLNNALTYDMLGANSQDVTVSKNKIQISRLGPADEITVLLMVENGVFTSKDIVQTLSKETKGLTVSKLDEVPPTGPQRVFLVALLVLAPVLIYGIFWALDHLFESSVQKVQKSAAPVPVTTSGWRMPGYARTQSPKLFADFESGRVSVAVGTQSRKGDVVSLTVKLQNGSDKILKFTCSMTSSGSEKRIPSYERRFNDVLVLPSQSEERAIRVIVPEKPALPAERLVFIECFVADMAEDSFSIKREYSAN